MTEKYDQPDLPFKEFDGFHTFWIPDRYGNTHEVHTEATASLEFRNAEYVRTVTTLILDCVSDKEGHTLVHPVADAQAAAIILGIDVADVHALVEKGVLPLSDNGLEAWDTRGLITWALRPAIGIEPLSEVA